MLAWGIVGYEGHYYSYCNKGNYGIVDGSSVANMLSKHIKRNHQQY